jgi:3-hydroxybutyryl-CoA dehydrogenase
LTYDGSLNNEYRYNGQFAAFLQHQSTHCCKKSIVLKMTIVVAQANPAIWNPQAQCTSGTNVVNLASAAAFSAYADADAFIDMNFDGSWHSPIDKPLLVNDTICTLRQRRPPHTKVARFCGWPGFCQRTLWEVATADGHEAPWLHLVMGAFGKQALVVQDVVGLVAPRTIAALANEACYALADGVATSTDIDAAMRLGTNYPLGPLEWAAKIGAAQVEALLAALAEEDTLYQPHPLIKTLV